MSYTNSAEQPSLIHHCKVVSVVTICI